MAMHHRLPGRPTGIEPDVVPCRPEILINPDSLIKAKTP